MNRRELLGSVGAVGAVGVGTLVATRGGEEASGDQEYETVRVPVDAPSIQAGVDEAGDGDLVLVEPGTYEEEVDIQTSGITLRGFDRNAVVLDGGFDRKHGVYVEADDVAVENLTVRHFQGNAVYWSHVEGFRGSFLTAYNNGYYGIYAYRSLDGRFEYSYASGHPDAGFYLGRNQPFEAVVSNVVAEYNSMGYSGTSTGEDLTIRDSVWRHNMCGIAPNTLDRNDPPEHSTHIVGNVVYANHNENTPSTDHTYPTFGTGIALWGGNTNVVEDNVVSNHENFGIAVHRNVEAPSGNAVRRNVVSGSGEADLALGTPTGDGNEFEDNQFATALPEGLQDDATSGSERVTEVYEEQKRRAEDGDFPGGDWKEQPEPGAQPTMRDPQAPPSDANKSTSLVE